MPKKKGVDIDKYVSYDENTNKSTCLIETCKKELSGKLRRNILRHYKLIHKLDIKSDDDSDNEITPVLPTSKKRKTTTEFSTNMSKSYFLKCCVGLVTKKSIPIRILDDKEFFKPLIAPYEEKFNINLSSKNISTVLEYKSDHIKSEIAALVKNKMVCLKIDIASLVERGILGVNIQYIDDFKICNNTIGMVKITNQDTAQDMKEEVLKCLDECNIGINQIYTYTTVNGANVIKLSNLLEETQHERLENEEVEIDADRCNQIEFLIETKFCGLPCIVHTIQLAANEVIQTNENNIEECRLVVKRLRTILESRSDEISFPHLDVAKTWDSTYNMINKLLSLKEFIESLGHFCNYIDWEFIENFIEAFTPLTNCTLKFESEQYVLGDFLRDCLTCELELGEIVATNKLATLLIDAMRKRRDMLLQHGAIVAAIYLDPRFNFSGTPFLTEDDRHRAMDHLLKTFEAMRNLKTDATHTEAPSCSNLSTSRDDTPTTSTNAYDKLDLHVQNLLKTQNLPAQRLAVSLKHKLMKLSEGERLTFGTNLLDYWRKSLCGDKEMAELVETVLAVPATQVSMRRSFDGLTTTLTNLKSKLSKKSLSNLLIVKHSYELMQLSNFDNEQDLSNISALSNMVNATDNTMDQESFRVLPSGSNISNKGDIIKEESSFGFKWE